MSTFLNNSALLSRHFLSLCLGWEFSHAFLVSSEFLSGMCLCCWLVAQLSPTHCHLMNCKPTSLLWPWGFPRQEYWSRLPSSLNRDICDPKMEFVSGLLWLLDCRQILYQGAKVYLGYMTHTINLKILNWYKGQMVKTKHLYLPTNNMKNLSF